jgi:triphosphatase
LTNLDDGQLHTLRIELKKLRYAVDGFGALLEGVTMKNLLKNLARLQDILGALNDIHVAERHISAEIAHRRGRNVTRLREGLVSWRATRVAKLRRKLGSTWRAYRVLNKSWRRELNIV